MNSKHRLTWQAAALALPLSLMSPATSLAQLNAPLSLGPPPCSLDNPQFNENVDAGKCSTSDILNGLATLPAPATKPSQDVQVTVESGQSRNPPTETALPPPIAEPNAGNDTAATTAPSRVVSPTPQAQAPLPQALPQPLTQPSQVAAAAQTDAGSRESAQPERDNILLVLFILLGVSVFILAALLLLPVLSVDKSDQ
ncbi:MAG: hypothetical protein SFV17_08230 [Candidatus Obscuribacter sp.]|jgi:hypothetical protein|nr:hypothetical protein [Candidatus Melainabacteria bacterium]MDX1986659.1 hypothetical protein [Candidatus Obscuribacter sp.]